MSRPTVVLVGHCGPDGTYLRIAVAKAAPGATLLAADDRPELESALGRQPALLLINRDLDGSFDGQSGPELIAALRQSYPRIKAMLVSNDAGAQAEAVSAGALSGFGKRELGSARVTDLLRTALAQSQ